MIDPASDGPSCERVVLLDDNCLPIGSALKSTVHTANTPLHLAFSCYVFAPDGRVLLTRRAIGKKSWPGVWTNSFCGHPEPGESMQDAIRRRGRQELGLTIADLHPAIPNFRYSATDAGGIAENEYCPVWTTIATSELRPELGEVCEWRWTHWEVLQSTVRQMPFLFSPWMQLQVPQLSLGVASDHVRQRHGFAG